MGGLGILNGKTATCFPGFEEKLAGAVCTGEALSPDGPVTTGKGMGWSLDLGLELVRLLIDGETAEALKKKIQYDRV